MPDNLPPNLLQAVRMHYGLRFGPLAAYLGVSASLLGMAALGHRELPTAALLRLQPLATALPPPWSQGTPDPDPAPDPRHLLAVLPAPPAARPPAPDALAARWLPVFETQAGERLGPAAKVASPYKYGDIK